MRLVVIKNVHKSDQLNEEMKVVALVRDLIFFQGTLDLILDFILICNHLEENPMYSKLPEAVHSSDDT